jgi:ribose transport system permease protein
MSVMQINPFLKDVVRGVVIVVAVAVYARRRIVNRPERFSSKDPAEVPAAQAVPAERP